jgi:hypothetical protein
MFEIEEMGQPGAPRKYKNPRRFTLWLDERLVSGMDEIRWRERKSFNEMLNKAVNEYIEHHKEGNDTFKLDTWQEDPDFKAIPTLLAAKEKWQRYVSECNNEELTQIGLHSSYVHGLVKLRRDKEFRERTKRR